MQGFEYVQMANSLLFLLVFHQKMLSCTNLESCFIQPLVSLDKFRSLSAASMVALLDLVFISSRTF